MYTCIYTDVSSASGAHATYKQCVTCMCHIISNLYVCKPCV